MPLDDLNVHYIIRDIVWILILRCKVYLYGHSTVFTVIDSPLLQLGSSAFISRFIRVIVPEPPQTSPV
jgi:hypothetical protein